MALIELLDVGKFYLQGNLRTDVLKHVNLKVENGEFVSVMGPSGSGKTTLMYILGLLDRPSNGRYLLNGKNVSDLNDEELSKLRGEYIGFVFQSFFLIPYLSVLENVLLPVEYLDRERYKTVFSKMSPVTLAKEHIQRLGMSERLNFRPDQLSGGQKQRVAIARALMNSPNIILADEPTGQLDEKSGKAVMDILKDLNRQGKTIIVVTHDPKIASYSNRIIRIKDGKIL